MVVVDLPAPLLPKDVYPAVIEERRRQAEEERIQKEEAEKRKKEEQEKKKKEEAEQKKKKEEEEQKKKAESQAAEEEKKSLKRKLVEAFWSAVDTVLEPVEDAMDAVLGVTMDPFTDRRYIAWLSVVTLAFNYNTWFISARLCFPYHSQSAIPLWLVLDLLADLVYLTDSVVFQPRKQFVKAGDIVVSPVLLGPGRLVSPAPVLTALLSSPFRQTESCQRRITGNPRDSRCFPFLRPAGQPARPFTHLSVPPQLDMLALLPFDLLYFQFGFKSIFRANRLLKVISSPCCL